MILNEEHSRTKIQSRASVECFQLVEMGIIGIIARGLIAVFVEICPLGVSFSSNHMQSCG